MLNTCACTLYTTNNILYTTNKQSQVVPFLTAGHMYMFYCGLLFYSVMYMYVRIIAHVLVYCSLEPVEISPSVMILSWTVNQLALLSSVRWQLFTLMRGRSQA